MDGDRSVRLAKALRNATRPPGPLFGNDVRTAYQLLARVLLHESGRQGFELAATRDADFHQVMACGGSPPGGPAILWGLRAVGGPCSAVRHPCSPRPQGKTLLCTRAGPGW